MVFTRLMTPDLGSQASIMTLQVGGSHNGLRLPLSTLRGESHNSFVWKQPNEPFFTFGNAMSCGGSVKAVQEVLNGPQLIGGHYPI